MFSGKWEMQGDHINCLELRALSMAVARRLRQKANLRTRGIHIVDSWVVLGCFSKGRSSPRGLNAILTQFCAICLAGSFMCLAGYVRTDWNPADRGSRLPLSK